MKVDPRDRLLSAEVGMACRLVVLSEPHPLIPLADPLTNLEIREIRRLAGY
jgi:hypothetical protein